MFRMIFRRNKEATFDNEQIGNYHLSFGFRFKGRETREGNIVKVIAKNPIIHDERKTRPIKGPYIIMAPDRPERIPEGMYYSEEGSDGAYDGCIPECPRHSVLSLSYELTPELKKQIDELESEEIILPRVIVEIESRTDFSAPLIRQMHERRNTEKYTFENVRRKLK